MTKNVTVDKMVTNKNVRTKHTSRSIKISPTHWLFRSLATFFAEIIFGTTFYVLRFVCLPFRFVLGLTHWAPCGQVDARFLLRVH